MSADFPVRKQLRLKNYDYAQHGAYFVTICTQWRLCLFGQVVDGKMILNEFGNMLGQIWENVASIVGDIELGPFVVMPNHFHGIIHLVGAALRGRPNYINCVRQNLQIHQNFQNCENLQINCPDENKNGDGRPQRIAPTKNPTLSDVIHRFKSFTTKQYVDGVKQKSWRPFEKQIWQRSFHDHIIRDENEYARICEYILLNPENWLNDEENPKMKK